MEQFELLWPRNHKAIKQATKTFETENSSRWKCGNFKLPQTWFAQRPELRWRKFTWIVTISYESISTLPRRYHPFLPAPTHTHIYRNGPPLNIPPSHVSSCLIQLQTETSRAKWMEALIGDQRRTNWVGNSSKLLSSSEPFLSVNCVEIRSSRWQQEKLSSSSWKNKTLSMTQCVWRFD